MRKAGYIFFPIFFLLCMTSCEPTGLFGEYRHIGNKGWHKDSAIVFVIHAEDTTATHDIFINIRNTGHYKNTNLWLSVDIRRPDGTVTQDMSELILTRSNGRWKGRGVGGIFENQFIYKQHMSFPVRGEYLFTIRHVMRTTTLKGIQDIGLSATPAKDTRHRSKTSS